MCRRFVCECWKLVGVFGFGRLVACVGVEVSRVCVGRCRKLVVCVRVSKACRLCGFTTACSVCVCGVSKACVWVFEALWQKIMK